MVIIDTGNGQTQLLQIAVPQDHLVPCPDAQILGNTGRKKHLILPRQRQLFFSLMEVNETGQFPAARNQVDFLHSVVKVQLHTTLMVEHHVGSVLLHGFPELFPLTVGGFLPEIDGNIIFRHMFELITRNVGDRVPQAEARQQQRRAAADTDEHHGKALLIAEDIADRDLVQEADFLPEGQLFHKDLFARLRRLGPDQFRRIFCQRLVAAPPGDIEHH